MLTNRNAGGVGVVDSMIRLDSFAAKQNAMQRKLLPTWGMWYPPSATSRRLMSMESSMNGYSGSSNKPQIHSPALRSLGSFRFRFG